MIILVSNINILILVFRCICVYITYRFLMFDDDDDDDDDGDGDGKSLYCRSSENLQTDATQSEEPVRPFTFGYRTIVPPPVVSF